jgi:predicted kinase
MNNKFLILLHGPMGSGKTTVSKLLNERIQPSVRVALPDVRRMLSGDQPDKADITRNVMLDMSRSYLQTDIPVIVEVVCKPDYIARYQTLAAEKDCRFLPYYLCANEQTRWMRVCARTADMMELDTLPKSKEAELGPIFTHNQDFFAGLQGELGTQLDTTYLSIDAVVQLIIDEVKTGNAV